MYNRRKFLKQSGAAALGGLLLRNANAFAAVNGASSQEAGVQLFTFFSVIDQDVTGTLKKIADVGYKKIESAFSRKGGYYGMKPKEFAALVKSLGLSWPAHHVIGAPFRLPAGAKPPTGADGKPISIPPMRNLKDNYQELVNEAAEGGVQYLVCASIPVNTADEIKEAVDVLGKTGEACKKAGITLAYHNHEAEFKSVEGQVPYDVFLTQLSADTMKMELDLAWAVKAGVNPVELFKKHPGRFPLWHVKDLNKETGKPVEVGTGYIDFGPFFKNANVAGLQHFFVEQDGAPKPLENITTSFKNLQRLTEGRAL